MDYLQQLFSRFFGTGDSDADYANYCSTPKKIVGFGNALLDYSREIDDKSVFERYQFEEGSVGLLDSDKLHTLAGELCAESSCVINPGGSVLNTVRILKRLGTDATFFGAIGADEHGKQITEILKEKFIDARLETIPDQPTGMCICMITKDKRTLYANIGAASKFSLDFLKSKIRGKNNDQTDASTCLRPVERKQIIYIEGFFVPEHEELCEYIVKYLIHDRRRLAFNLSAPYVIQQNFAQVLHLCQHAFFIFSNAEEFAVLTEYMGCNSMEDAARNLLQHGTVAKIIVITDGAKSIQLVTNFIDESSPPGEILFQNFNVPRADNVVDTTGAGDSFVAGFLHAWLEKRQVSECIRYACDIAIQVLTQIGCNLPEEST